MTFSVSGLPFVFKNRPTADGLVGLGSLKAYCSGYSYASGVSADGTIVAGYSESDDGIYQAFMYRAKVVDPTPVNPTPPGTMLDLDNTQVAIVQAAQQQEQMVQSRGTTLVTLLGSELALMPIARPGQVPGLETISIEAPAIKNEVRPYVSLGLTKALANGSIMTFDVGAQVTSYSNEPASYVAAGYQMRF